MSGKRFVHPQGKKGFNQPKKNNNKKQQPKQQQQLKKQQPKQQQQLKKQQQQSLSKNLSKPFSKVVDDDEDDSLSSGDDGMFARGEEGDSSDSFDGSESFDGFDDSEEALESYSDDDEDLVYPDELSSEEFDDDDVDDDDDIRVQSFDEDAEEGEEDEGSDSSDSSAEYNGPWRKVPIPEDFFGGTHGAGEEEFGGFVELEEMDADVYDDFSMKELAAKESARKELEAAEAAGMSKKDRKKRERKSRDLESDDDSDEAGRPHSRKRARVQELDEEVEGDSSELLEEDEDEDEVDIDDDDVDDDDEIDDDDDDEIDDDDDIDDDQDDVDDDDDSDEATAVEQMWQAEEELTLAERRKRYACGSKFVQLKDIPTWREYSLAHGLEPASVLAHGVAEGDSLALADKISHYTGDITTLEVDAIVNAANNSCLGGGGVDGIIHRRAGPALLGECRSLNGCDTGQTKVTRGYNLPARFVLHSVGPVGRNDALLTSCYRTALRKMEELGLRTIAFCGISTGIFGFPLEPATRIAVSVVREWLMEEGNADKVDRIIFCTYLAKERSVYDKVLPQFFPINPVTKSKKEAVQPTSQDSESEEAEENGESDSEGHFDDSASDAEEQSQTQAVDKKRLDHVSKGDQARGLAYQPGTLPVWEKFNMLDERLLRGICAMFGPDSSPTPIQENTLLPAIRDKKDIVGVARTGSGKTLAFLLPILQGLIRDDMEHELRLERLNSQSEQGPMAAYPNHRGIRALILAPTRELGLQIAAELRSVAQFDDRFGQRRGSPAVVTVVGGISEQKQERLLVGKLGRFADPQILIATPGRLWHYLKAIEEAGGPKPYEEKGVGVMDHWRRSTLAWLGRDLQFLCVDEADRMVAHRHFPELKELIRFIQKNEGMNDEVKQKKLSEGGFTDDFFDEIPDFIREKMERRAARSKPKKSAKEDDEVIKLNYRVPERHTLVFSATLSMARSAEPGSEDREQKKKPKHTSKKDQKKASKRAHGAKTAEETAVELLIELLAFKGKLATVDLTAGQRLSPLLDEYQMICSGKNDKEKLLYYILLDPLSEPAFSLSETSGTRRVLIFVNTVDTARRLAGLLRALNIRLWLLHGAQQQKQRMNALEKFARPDHNPVHVLIATDVAARGIDIPMIDVVVHFDAAQTADLYVHRCGRTARVNECGTSITLLKPDDIPKFKQLLALLAKSESAAAEAAGSIALRRRPTRLPEMPVDGNLLKGESLIVRRITLAMQIDKEQNSMRRTDAEDAWRKKAARDAELGLSDDDSDLETDARGMATSKVPLHALKGRQRQRAEAISGLDDEDEVNGYLRRQNAALERRKLELEAALSQKLPREGAGKHARAVNVAEALLTTSKGTRQAPSSHTVSSFSIREKAISGRREKRAFALALAQGKVGVGKRTRGGNFRGRRGGRR